MKTLRFLLSRLALAVAVAVFSTQAAMFLAGCNTAPEGYVSVPRLPAWQAPADARTYTVSEISNAIFDEVGFVAIDTTDNTFTPVNHAWLEKLASWSWEFGKATGISYTPESFDCDKFAEGFAFAANIAAARAGVRAQPLLARVYVVQRDPFGNVPAGGRHALNGFLSDRGATLHERLYIFEPQSRTFVRLGDYPNRTSIERIRIGG